MNEGNFSITAVFHDTASFIITGGEVSKNGY